MFRAGTDEGDRCCVCRDEKYGGVGVWRKNNSNGLNDETDKSFFYSRSMLSADSEHAGIGHAGKGHVDVVYYYNVLYNMMMVQSDRARLQAESITDDSVLADLIAEQILMYAGIRDSCSPEHSS
ncbi:MAG: hypothetical protein KKA79_01790, partial [Nanoarchaeota archaeon]|nr:hypothetical protein [Nanoarchaeota archaeon]